MYFLFAFGEPTLELGTWPAQCEGDSNGWCHSSTTTQWSEDIHPLRLHFQRRFANCPRVFSWSPSHQDRFGQQVHCMEPGAMSLMRSIVDGSQRLWYSMILLDSWFISIVPCSLWCIKTLWLLSQAQAEFQRVFPTVFAATFCVLMFFLWGNLATCVSPASKLKFHQSEIVSQPQAICQFDEIIASSQAPPIACTTNHLNPSSWAMDTRSNRCSPFWGVKWWRRGSLFMFQVGKL